MGLFFREKYNFSPTFIYPPRPPFHSLCSTTITPIIPSITCFSHGCSLNKMVMYPTKGMKPMTLPITSSLRFRKVWPVAYSSVSSAMLLSPFVRSRRGVLLQRKDAVSICSPKGCIHVVVSRLFFLGHLKSPPPFAVYWNGRTLTLHHSA